MIDTASVVFFAQRVAALAKLNLDNFVRPQGENSMMSHQPCWRIWHDRGFLISPDPLESSPLIPSDVLDIARNIPTLLQDNTLQDTLQVLPVHDYTDVLAQDAEGDFRLNERLMQIYSYFASSYVYSKGAVDDPTRTLPNGVAVPFVQLAAGVQRPPILSYSGYVLSNWRRIDPAGPIALGNIETIQHFRGGRDEDWFILVHVDIEARAAGGLVGIQTAAEAANHHDIPALEAALTNVHDSLAAMVASFHRMPEGVDTDIYYWKVRPYIFSFTDIVYDGVAAFSGQPQSYRGQTGAQSSIVPALVAAFGLQHEQSGLTQHLDIMKDYMPKPHHEFIAAMENSRIREVVIEHFSPTLSQVYNACLERLLEFRRLHYHYATIYIAQKVTSPVGTGGTIFMDWLNQLADETEAQRV
jgi:indoleamine 2,3-dioxygenase